jgi:type II secretory pathway pseudopilin PulG
MSNPYADGQNRPVAQPKKSNTTAIIIVVLGVLCFVFLVCGGILAALLLPAIQQAREAARRTSTANNMRIVSLALMNYEQAFKKFPPAYTVDAEGNKLHSWRTIILPFLEETAVYESIDFSKPWDAPENSAARNAVIRAFDCPSVELPPGQTLFQVIVDPRGIFTGPQQTALRDILDGMSNTILIAQAGKDHAVHWMEPRDMDLQYFTTLDPKASAHPGGAHVVLSDGAVQFLLSDTDPETKTSMVTRAGNDVVGP